MATRKKIGLALGSGAFRGFAHIGVLKTLEKHKIKIDYLTGSSIGAWAAAHYAIFHDAAKLERDVANDPEKNLAMLFDFSWTGGFINGRKFAGFLEHNLHHHNFSSLKTPLKIVATDLISGQPFVFFEGDVARAVRASVSVPLVFKPEKYNYKLLVDGGLSNPVPVDLVRAMGADIVVGVNLYHRNEFVDKKFTMPKVILRSTRIVLHNLSNIAVKKADVIIEPDISSFAIESGFGKYFTKDVVQKIICLGEQATEKAIPKIKKLL